jgi:hypothetical protein
MTQRLRSLEVDDQLELGRLFDGHIVGLVPCKALTSCRASTSRKRCRPYAWAYVT